MDIKTCKKQTLLGNIAFAQWVIQSDVVVAQSNQNLAVWYNIDLPEHVTMLPIRGDAFEVTRENVSIFFIINPFSQRHQFLGPHDSKNPRRTI